MNFDLIRPCKDCPFRTDIAAFLTPERAQEIGDAITKRQQTFTCHKTNRTEADDDGCDTTIETRDSQHCAGALVLLESIGQPNQLMRIAERLGGYDRAKLDMTSPVFKTIKAFVAAQRVRRSSKIKRPATQQPAE